MGCARLADGCWAAAAGVLYFIAWGPASSRNRRAAGPPRLKDLRRLKTKSTIVQRAGGVSRANSGGMLSPARLRVVQNAKLTDRYDLSDEVVGEGASGEVTLVTERASRKSRVLKTLHLANAEDENHVNDVLNEMEVYLRLDHPNICRLLEVNVEDAKCHLIMEHCLGRELYERLEESGPYSETEAATALSQMLDALQYLHSRRICHRDLKLENWIYADLTPNARLKLIDFGFSKVVSGDAPMTDLLGTAYYMAPEVIAGSYDFKCDMWSTGVIAYLLLMGYPPIGEFEDSDMQILRKIKSGAPIKMGTQDWISISPVGRSFVSTLLQRDPAKRPTAKLAANHHWLAAAKEGSRTPPSPQMDKQVLESMTAFASYSVIKRAACCLIAFLISFEETEELEAQFKAMDKDKTGTICRREFVDALREHLGVPEEQAAELFRKLDLTGDHQLTYSEFLAAACQSRLLQHEESIKEAFARFDNDSTGNISVENLRNALGEEYHGLKVEEILAQVDKDGNGVIDYNEFTQALHDIGRAEINDLKSNLEAGELCKINRASSVATTVCSNDRFSCETPLSSC